MKLCRIRTDAGVKPAALDGDGVYRDLSAHCADLNQANITAQGLSALAHLDLMDLPQITGTPAPFLADFRRIFCFGLNYYDHAAEMDLDVPEHPILFMKACAPSGANDPIVLPKGSTKTDWEVELGVVIGATAQHVSHAQAQEHIAGYCVANDVSERSFQMDFGGQWVKGKSADSFAPVGPYLVTKDEIPDAQNLAMSLELNGKPMQNGSTATMIFPVPEIIAHLSQFLTLHPGDLILTGTPPGVGGGKKPPQFLKSGDVVTASIERLGEINQKVVSFET